MLIVMKNNRIVLDSFAVISYFQKEQRSSHIVDLFKAAQKGECKLILSLVNWGEIYYIIARARGKNHADQCLLLMEQLPIELEEVSKELVLKAAYFKSKYSISYGDCFAAALAYQEQCPLLTGDPEFKKIEQEVKINWL